VINSNGGALTAPSAIRSLGSNVNPVGNGSGRIKRGPSFRQHNHALMALYEMSP
jgi:hypothetical protein